MRRFPGAGIVGCMPPEHARLTIVFDLQADPVAGLICDDANGPGAQFAGWMELTRAIERALAAARHAADPKVDS